MGSTTHIVDEAGNVQNRYEYDAWGNLTVQEEAIPNRFKYTGQQFDPVTQQYYLRARFYNPILARFTQEDTYRGDGLNLYVYCANNPVYYVDPTGNYRNCVKDAYNRIRQENLGMSAQEAYQRALQERGFDKLSKEDNRRRSEAANLNRQLQDPNLTPEQHKQIFEKLDKKNNEFSSTNQPPKPKADLPDCEPEGKEDGEAGESGSTPELKVVGTYNNNKRFTRAVEFNAGPNGTGFTYKVYQRNDIDWDMVRTGGAKKGRGLTNAQAAEKHGLAPILNDGSVATLHHSQQKSVGPLFEASTRYHNISNAKKGPLHPYKGQLNPFYPMDKATRNLFQSVDSIEYWKARGRDAMKGVQ